MLREVQPGTDAHTPISSAHAAARIIFLTIAPSLSTFDLRLSTFDPRPSTFDLIRNLQYLRRHRLQIEHRAARLPRQPPAAFAGVELQRARAVFGNMHARVRMPVKHAVAT